MNYSIAVFDKSHNVKFIHSYGDFLKYTIKYDDVLCIVEENMIDQTSGKSKLSFNHAQYIKNTGNKESIWHFQTQR